MKLSTKTLAISLTALFFMIAPSAHAQTYVQFQSYAVYCVVNSSGSNQLLSLATPGQSIYQAPEDALKDTATALRKTKRVKIKLQNKLAAATKKAKKAAIRADLATLKQVIDLTKSIATFSEQCANGQLNAQGSPFFPGQSPTPSKPSNPGSKK